MIADRIPYWLAWPASFLSTVAAVFGAGFMLWAAASGDPWRAVHAGIAFLAAAFFWHVGDMASGNRPI